MDIDPSVTLRHAEDDDDYVIDPGAQLTALAILEDCNQPRPYPRSATALVSHEADFEPGPPFIHHASFPSDWIDSSAFVLGDSGADFEPDPALSGEMALMPGRSFNTVHNESQRPPDLSAGAGFATDDPSSEEMMSWGSQPFAVTPSLTIHQRNLDQPEALDDSLACDGNYLFRSDLAACFIGSELQAQAVMSGQNFPQMPWSGTPIAVPDPMDLQSSLC